VAPLSAGQFRGVEIGVFTVVEDTMVDFKLSLDVELLVEDVILSVTDKLKELLLLMLSLNSVRPFGPPHVSVSLALQGMLQRPSVTGREFAFNAFPQ
jgi:hypothetical protein